MKMPNRAVFAAFTMMMTLLGGSAWGAYKETYWTGAAGDGKWGTAGNWSDGVPGSTTTYTWRAHFKGKTCTVEIEEGATYKNDMFDVTDGSHVTLVGSGTLKNDNWTYVDAGADFTVNGPTVTIKNAVDKGVSRVNGAIYVKSGDLQFLSTVTFGGTANVFLEGGTFGATGQDLILTNSAELVISGGKASFYKYTVHGPYAPGETGGLIRLTGGVLNNTYGAYTYTSQVRPGGRLENLGGTILWGTTSSFQYSRLSSSSSSSQGQGATFSNFLPRVGAVLNIPSHSTNNTGSLYFAVDGDYADVGGTIFVTNMISDVIGAASESAGNVSFAASSVALRGGATLYANAIKASDKVTATYDLDLTRLNLGMGGIRRTATGKSQKFNFLDGIVFGAWGDYASSDSTSLTVSLAGPVTYATLDCFDKTTTHDVAMSRVNMDDVSDFKATGGGTVTLAPLSFEDEFRTLEVAENTTLAFAGGAANLKAMNLKLGANATLKIDLSAGGFVDAAATATFGTGAKIVVTALPATLTEGNLYPVYFAPAGTDPDLSKIEFAADVCPTGWSLAKTGSAVYLTDGHVTAYTTSTTPSKTDPFWSGAGSDNLFTNQENWVGYVQPSDQGQPSFNGLSNTVINLDVAEECRYFVFGADAGPFVFNGETIDFRYMSDGGIPSVRNLGKFPVVFNNDIENNGTGAEKKRGFVHKCGSRIAA